MVVGVFATVGQMLTAQQRLLDVAEEIESRYQHIQGTVDDLLGRHWKGMAPKVHQELWSEWDDGFRVVQTALTGMANKIGEIARAFHAADSV